MNKLGDIWYNEPQETLWDKVKAVFLALLVMAMFLFVAAIGSAYEDHIRCLNGYEEVCIPEDFQ